MVFYLTKNVIFPFFSLLQFIANCYCSTFNSFCYSSGHGHAPAPAPAPAPHVDTYGSPAAPEIQYGFTPTYDAPAPSYHAPAPSYHAPAPSYHAPAPSYHAPAPSYHAPAPSYHEPAPSYHAPAPSYHEPAPSYHAPAPSYHKPTYEAPKCHTEYKTEYQVNFIANVFISGVAVTKYSDLSVT